jgi:hypothetical protein
MKTYRAWINQPSTLQPLHSLHGKYCIVIDDDQAFVKLCFTEGDIHSMMADRKCVSQVHLSGATQSK